MPALNARQIALLLGLEWQLVFKPELRSRMMRIERVGARSRNVLVAHAGYSAARAAPPGPLLLRQGAGVLADSEQGDV